MHFRVRLSALDTRADLGAEEDPGREVDRVALLLASGAEADRREPDAVRREVLHPGGARSAQRLDVLRPREAIRIVDGARVAALCRDKLAELRQTAAVLDGALDAHERGLVVARLPREDEHLRRRERDETPQILRALAAQRVDGLAHF